MIGHSTIKKILFILLCAAVGCNFLLLFKTYRLALAENRLRKPPQPGCEFLDFKPKLAPLKIVGFFTDKDMSSERNDGQFLAAQYTLAPVILDLNNPRHRLVILDYTSFIAAFEKIRAINARPVYVNGYGKILAERNYE